ncbi:MAG TPA: PEP-CTERM sorting domain-containing protein [Burkholderiales bacterium]|nr:PEP-CTERM sorting domain-containing protein [Burkholderiales bacterium]
MGVSLIRCDWRMMLEEGGVMRSLLLKVGRAAVRLVFSAAVFGFHIDATAQVCSSGFQISPNPNDVGNTITVTPSSNGCNSTITAPGPFENHGTVTVPFVSVTPGFPGNQFSNFFGTFNNRSTGVLDNNGAQVSNIQSTIVNSGVIRNQAGGTFFNFQGSTISNIGVFNNSAATLSNLGTFTSSGIINNQTAASFLNFGGATFTSTTVFANNGSRVDNLSGGLWRNNGSGSIQNFGGGTFNNSGTFDSNSQLSEFSNDGGATVNNSGSMTSRGGFFLSGGAALNNNFGGSFQTTHIFHNLGGIVNNNAGATIINNTGTSGPLGSLVNDVGSAINNSGAIVNSQFVVNAGVFNNNPGGSLINNRGVENIANGTFNNALGSTITNNFDFVNRGNVISSGTIDGTGRYTQHSGSTTFNGAVTQNTVTVNGGVLNGAANITGSVIVNGGIIAPGNSPGQMTILGNYSQGALGSFEAEIGGLLAGSQYDVLDVTGTATLDGTLLVSLYNLGSGTFAPSAGDTFDIIRAMDVIGSFSTLSFAPLAAGLMWQVSYLDNVFGSTDVVRLSILDVAAPVPEPETYAMLLAGLALLGFATRRRQRLLLCGIAGGIDHSQVARRSLLLYARRGQFDFKPSTEGSI